MQFVVNNFSMIQHTSSGCECLPHNMCSNMALDVVISSISNKYLLEVGESPVLPPLKVVVYPDVAALSVLMYDKF